MNSKTRKEVEKEWGRLVTNYYCSTPDASKRFERKLIDIIMMVLLDTNVLLETLLNKEKE